MRDEHEEESRPLDHEDEQILRHIAGGGALTDEQRIAYLVRTFKRYGPELVRKAFHEAGIPLPPDEPTK